MEQRDVENHVKEMIDIIHLIKKGTHIDGHQCIDHHTAELIVFHLQTLNREIGDIK